MAITCPEVAMAVAVPLRTDLDAAQLRALAKQSRDADQTRRLLALAAIYDGASRTEAAQIGCVTLQIVRDWVLRFNARGPEGLLTGRAPGARLGSMASIERLCRPSSSRVRSRPFTAWCAGAWSIWFSGSGRSSASPSPSRRCLANCAPWAIASSRPARATTRRARRRWPPSKKLPRPPGGDHGRPGRRQAPRDLVRRRGPGWAEEQDHAPLG